jgi:hypothetical protein
MPLSGDNSVGIMRPFRWAFIFLGLECGSALTSAVSDVAMNREARLLLLSAFVMCMTGTRIGTRQADIGWYEAAPPLQTDHQESQNSPQNGIGRYRPVQSRTHSNPVGVTIFLQIILLQVEPAAPRRASCAQGSARTPRPRLRSKRGARTTIPCVLMAPSEPRCPWIW